MSLVDVIKAIGWVAAVYMAVLALLYVMQRALIYVPDRHRPEPAAYGVPEMSPVVLRTSDGLELLAWWRPPKARGSAPVIVYFHGNAGHIGYRGLKVRGFLNRGWGVLLTTWRGYSGNTGSPTEQGLYADGRAAMAFLDGQGIRPDQTVFYGESLGSGVAVALAAERGGRALVLEAPFSSLADAAAAQYPIFPVRLLLRDRYDNLSRIGRIGMPLAVIHGEDDRVVPADHGRRLLAAAAPPKEGFFIPGAGHNNLYEHGAAAIVAGFIERHMGNATVREKRP